MKDLPADKRKVLLSEHTSRINKLWIAIAWQQRYTLEWRWKGLPLRSRLEFQFEADGPFVEARSFEEDVLSTFDDRD